MNEQQAQPAGLSLSKPRIPSLKDALR